MKRYGRGGWYGDSSRHRLAARGISTNQKYLAKKQELAEPLFYARKRESELPFSHITQMVKEGGSYQSMINMHPKADKEDLRLRGIKAIENRDMDNTLSMIDKNGVDKTVELAEANPRTREKVLRVLNCRQRGSFIPSVKREAILKNFA